MTYIVETDIPCPWCGEYFPTTVDTSQGGYTTIEEVLVMSSELLRTGPEYTIVGRARLGA